MELVYTINALYGAVGMTLFVCFLMVLSLLKEERQAYKLQKYYDYRKRAVNGLVFDDCWKPSERDRVYAESMRVLLAKQTEREGYYLTYNPMEEDERRAA